MSELYHYGIQGQKWGVRRYQNEDGTYTTEGKERYQSLKGHSLGKKQDRNLMKEIYKTQKKAGKKFDKHTEKILRDKEKGKKISDRRIKKAIELGTEYRMQDYNAKNFDEYAKYNRNLKNAAGFSYMGGTAAKLANQYRVSKRSRANGKTASDRVSLALGRVLPNAALLTSTKIVEKKSSYTKKGEQFAEKARKETIKDLKKHGIIDSTTKTDFKSKKKVYMPKSSKQASNTAKANIIFQATLQGLFLGGKVANSIIQSNKEKKAMGIKPKSFYKKVYSFDDDTLKNIKMKDIGNDYNDDWNNDIKRLKAG